MMKKSGLILSMGILLSGLLPAAESLTAGKPDEFIGNAKVDFANGETTVTGSGSLYSKKQLKIDTKKRYRLSGEFKARKESKQGDFFRFGVYPASKYSQIQAININIVPGSDTELAADCQAGDKVLRLKDASKWKGNALTTVAFDTDPSGKLSDLPNFNMSKTGAASLVNKNGIWELTLKAPCGKNYPMGTTVREHLAGWSVIYAGTTSQTPSGEWQKIDVVIEPGETPSASIKNWWKGTEKAGFILDVSGSGLVFRNLKLEEVQP